MLNNHKPLFNNINTVNKYTRNCYLLYRIYTRKLPSHSQYYSESDEVAEYTNTKVIVNPEVACSNSIVTPSTFASSLNSI